MNYYIPIILLTLGVAACNSGDQKQIKPVAKVHGNYLYLNQVEEVIPKNRTKEDSLIISENYIRQWIKKQLLITKAEQNLTDSEKDVSKLVEDYRTSLIIHKYQQQLVKQKLDTAVTQSEIEEYYKNNKQNFILAQNIIKAVFIKIRKPVINLKKVKQLYKSNNESNIERLKDYCFQNATKFDNFNDQWIYSSNLLNKIPLHINKEELFLSKNKYFEAQDSVFHYFVKILDLRLRNSLAPLPFMKDKVKRIILNKRKIKFINNLEENIFRDAQARNEFKIY